MHKNVKMVSHHAPTKEFDAAKFRSSANHFQKILALIIFQKVNPVSDTADKMMNCIVFFYPIIGV
jgi:hypothetical protein